MSDLPDPQPENIDGAKTVEYSHEIHHRVNWGYVALAVAGIAVLLVIHQNVDLGGDESEETGGMQ
ncbi:hypothetical protein GJ633_14725 [Halorubrum sp. CBA1125]|uniref:hypothetical protein n=1 Tax=Halorubrum sp. CBA1125 TaxID=2668072 RepID=UPI0012E8E28D|nr:hypothetical protein [Halorubrum sp. CBA1125]MUW15736.1 hypothetical protein [Halorubrum sp. CBA1125]